MLGRELEKKVKEKQEQLERWREGKPKKKTHKTKKDLKNGRE